MIITLIDKSEDILNSILNDNDVPTDSDREVEDT